ncbi:MAG: DNA polymerase III subunit delta [Rickettsiales bacterium]|nr:DNA polymerase III subunit delta [Rickettsiales bacterium]
MKIAAAQIDFYIQKIAQEKIAGCLVFGPETSVVNYRFDLIAKKISPDLSDPFLVVNLSKERLNEDKGILADEFFSLSMLGGRKLVLIKDADIAAAGALKILFEESDFAKKSDNFILILAGDLDKSSSLRKLAEDNPHFATIACYEDNENTIKRFISLELAKNQIKSSPQVTELLLQKFGKNRQIILSEVEKISLYLGDSKELTDEKLSKINDLEGEISVNEFITSFAEQKFDLALIKLEKLFNKGFEPIMLIRFIANYLQKLYQAKCEIEFSGIDFETAVKSQRLFFKTEIEFRKNLTALPLKFLTRNLQKLAELEIKIKTTSTPAKLLFIAFIQDEKIFKTNL